MPSSTVQARIRQNPRFTELVTRRTRLALVLSLLVLVPYYSFMMVVAFAPDLLKRTIAADSIITVAWPLGVLLVVGSWLLTGVYIYRANGEFDDLNQAVLKESVK